MKALFWSFFLTAVIWGYELSGAITGNHDPSQIISENERYYLFSTADNLNLRVSTDLFHWTWGSKPFRYAQGIPEYMVPWCQNGNDTPPWNIWAPEIIKNGTSYYLYVSRNCPRTVNGVYQEQSILGLHTSPSLASPNWSDQGTVISVDLNTAGYRVIDPALLFDQENRLWLAVGSFGSSNALGYNNGGIRIFELNPSTGKLMRPTDQGIRIAGPWIEAPYLYYHNGYYYLFFNERRCCEGLRSTYFVRVGRSAQITGPYLDQDGVDLNNQGGSLFAGLDYAANYADDNRTPSARHGRTGRELGPGHIGIFTTPEGLEFYTYHYYDSATAHGEPTLGMRSLIWGDDGWPRFGWNPLDGVYSIGSTLMSTANTTSGGLFLKISSASPEQVIFSSWDGSPAQLWYLHRVAPNQFQIRNLHNNLSLQNTRGVVSLALYNTNDLSFRWEVRQAQDRSFILISALDGKALTVRSPSFSPTLDSYANTPEQRQWINPAGTFRIRNQWNNLYLSYAQNSSSTEIQVQTRSENPSQIWQFTPTRDGYVKVRNLANGLVLDLPSASRSDNIPLSLSADSETETQRWSLEPLPDSSWRVIHKRSGKVADIGAQTPAVIQMRWLSTRSQQWSLEYMDSLQTLWKQEAELFCSADGIEEQLNPGYEGTGYLNMNNILQASASWSVRVQTAGDYPLFIRYANQSAMDRAMALSVNGTIQNSSWSFPSTASWTSWTVAQTRISLRPGINILKLSALTPEGGPNLDWLAIPSSQLSAASCDSDATRRVMDSWFSPIHKIRNTPNATKIRLYNLRGQRLATLNLRQLTPASPPDLSQGLYLLEFRDQTDNILSRQLLFR